MKAATAIIAFGTLQQRVGTRDGDHRQIQLDRPTLLVDILDLLRIPTDYVQMVMVNHKAVHIDTAVNPGDRVALFPREYPIFVDWKNYRRTDGYPRPHPYDSN